MKDIFNIPRESCFRAKPAKRSWAHKYLGLISLSDLKSHARREKMYKRMYKKARAQISIRVQAEVNWSSLRIACNQKRLWPELATA